MVVTTDHSICYGSHFISSATIRQTCYNIFHTFLARSEVTNADNLSVWTILQRFIGYFDHALLRSYFQDPDLNKTHLPDLKSSTGVLDLFTLLATLELSIALHPQTYEKTQDSNAHWARAQRTKIHSIRLLNWFNAHFTIYQDEEEIDLYPRLLVQIIMSFLNSLANGRKKGLLTKHYNLDRLLYEIEEVIASHPETAPMMKERLKYISPTFEYKSIFKINIKKDPQWSIEDLPNVPMTTSPPLYTKAKFSLEDFLGEKDALELLYPAQESNVVMKKKPRRK